MTECACGGKKRSSACDLWRRDRAPLEILIKHLGDSIFILLAGSVYDWGKGVYTIKSLVWVPLAWGPKGFPKTPWASDSYSSYALYLSLLSSLPVDDLSHTPYHTFPLKSMMCLC